MGEVPVNVPAGELALIVTKGRTAPAQAKAPGFAVLGSPPSSDTLPRFRQLGMNGQDGQPVRDDSRVTVDKTQRENPVKGGSLVDYSRKQKEIAASTTVDRERGLGHYLSLSEMTVAQLKGGIVLDVGSGARLLFAKEAKEYGIKVISLNPDLSHPGFRSMSKEDHPHLHSFWDRRRIKVPAIAALGQILPVRDNSVGAAFDIGAATFYLDPERENYERYYNELRRVTSPGGQITIAYWQNEPPSQKEELIAEEMARFAQDGYSVSHGKAFLEEKECDVYIIRKPKKPVSTRGLEQVL